MIALPAIPLSARFRTLADRESARFLDRVHAMRWCDLRPLSLAGHGDEICVSIRLGHGPRGAVRSIAVEIARAPRSASDPASTRVRISWEPAFEHGRLRSAIFLRHAETQVRARLGARPFLTETDAELAITSRDGIHPSVLRSICGEDEEEALIGRELAARLARQEIERRRGESNHAWLSRLASGRGSGRGSGA